MLQEIEQADLIGNAARRGVQIRDAVLAMGSPLVTEVRGRGLLIGIGVVEGAAHADRRRGARARAHRQRRSTRPRIRIAPPLIVGDAEIAEFADRFGAALAAC